MIVIQCIHMSYDSRRYKDRRERERKIVTADTYLPPGVGPRAKFEIAKLIVKGKPCNVDLARAFKDAGWHVKTFSIA